MGITLGDENEMENAGAINRSNTKTDAFGFNLQSLYDSQLLGKNNTFIGGINYDFSKNSFGRPPREVFCQTFDR